MNKQLNFPKRTAIITTIALLTIGFIAFIWHLAHILLIIFAAILLAVFLNGLSSWFSAKIHVPVYITLPIAILILLLCLGGFAWIIGPRILDQLSRLTEKIPQAIDSIETAVASTQWGKKWLSDMPTAKDLLPVGSDLLVSVTGAFSSTFNVIASSLIILFIGIYLAADPDVYTNNLMRLFPKSKRKRVGELLHAIGRCLRWWLAGRFASMAIVGVLTFVGLWAVGVPLALSLGVITAVLSFVPFIGPVLAAVPMALVALSEDPVMVLWALGVYLAVQLLESYLITPFIQKRAVFIPPALLIAMQILMAVMFGLIGIFLATPLALVIILIIQMLYVEDILGEKVRLMGDHSPDN